jgi:hypothetical protein
MYVFDSVYPTFHTFKMTQWSFTHRTKSSQQCPSCHKSEEGEKSASEWAGRDFCPQWWHWRCVGHKCMPSTKKKWAFYHEANKPNFLLSCEQPKNCQECYTTNRKTLLPQLEKNETGGAHYHHECNPRQLYGQIYHACDSDGDCQLSSSARSKGSPGWSFSSRKLQTRVLVLTCLSNRRSLFQCWWWGLQKVLVFL